MFCLIFRLSGAPQGQFGFVQVAPPCISFIIPLYFLCISFVIPSYFLCISFVFPLHFLCSSFVFPLSSLCISFVFPWHFLSIPFAFPLHFLSISFLFPMSSLGGPRGGRGWVGPPHVHPSPPTRTEAAGGGRGARSPHPRGFS